MQGNFGFNLKLFPSFLIGETAEIFGIKKSVPVISSNNSLFSWEAIGPNSFTANEMITQTNKPRTALSSQLYHSLEKRKVVIPKGIKYGPVTPVFGKSAVKKQRYNNAILSVQKGCIVQNSAG